VIKNPVTYSGKSLIYALQASPKRISRLFFSIFAGQ